MHPGARQRACFLACAAAALLPLWLLPTDFWDGEIIDFGFRSSDFTGVEKWLLESRWNLLYYLLQGIRGLADATRIDHRLLIPAVASVAVLGVAAEVKRLAESTFRLSGKAPFHAAIFALLFPAWHVLTSSVLLIHVLCVWWALLGYRLTKTRFALLGVPVAAASLQLNSNFAFLVGLAVADDLATRFLRRESGGSILRPLAWGVVLSLSFVLLRVGFPAYGEYSTYNAPELSVSRAAGLVQYGVLTLPYALLLAASYRLGRRRDPTERRELLWRVVLLLGLATCAVVPYVVVGKPAHLEDFDGWTHRNAFLLVVFHALTLAIFTGEVERTGGEGGTRSWARRACLPICAGASALALYVGYDVKVAHAVYTGAAVEALREIEAPPPGAVILRFDDPSPIEMRPYEQNAMLEKAYGRAAWVHIPRSSRWAAKLRAAYLQPHAFKAMWIFPAMTPECHAIIDVASRKAPGWRIRSWLHLLGLVERPVQMKARTLDVKCGPRSLPAGPPPA